MSQKEVEHILRSQGAVAYRRFGKVKIAHAKEVGEKVLPVMIRAVEAYTRLSKIDWAEPDMDTMKGWSRAGLQVTEVCDDPVPADVKLDEVSINWLVDCCRRYHFKLTVVDGKLSPVSDDGYKMEDVKKNLPSWFMPICGKRKQELIGALK